MRKAFTLLLLALFSTAFALAQQTVTYQPAQYPAGLQELHRAIAQNVRPDKRLLSYMNKEGISEVSATIGLIINSKGKLVAVEVLETSDSQFNEKHFEKLVSLFRKEEFIPGSINGEPTATSLIIKGFKLGVMSSVSYSVKKERGSTFKTIK